MGAIKRDTSRVWTAGDEHRALTLQAELKVLEERGLPLPPNDLLELNHLASKYEAYGKPQGNHGEMPMPQRKPDLDLYTLTAHVRCRACGEDHRVPVLFERQHMAPLAEIAGDPTLAQGAGVKRIMVECPRIDHAHLATTWNIGVPYDTVYVAHGTARL